MGGQWRIPVDPYQSTPSLHSSLPPMRLVNQRTQEHVGPCPFCGGDSHISDRFHVWLEPGKERYWCRACDAKGPYAKLLGEEIRPRIVVHQMRTHQNTVAPTAAHQDRYRQIYNIIALWAHMLLCDEANPEPLAYIHQRGITDATVGHAALGVTLRDPQAIPDLLRRECPDLLPYAEEAGVLSRDYTGQLRAHPNLCGALLFSYLADGEVVDIRARSYPGKGYRSLAGSYTERGATTMFGWDSLGDTDTVLITEGEFKALAVTQAYHAGHLSAPALAHPGLSYMREEWAADLLARGVRTVYLAYDSQPRTAKDGCLPLTPEEVWTIRHGLRLAAAGLEVRVLRLPLAPGETKADLDEFILQHRPARLQHLIDIAPRLAEYHRSLPRHLVTQAKLPSADTATRRRARPTRMETAVCRPADPTPSLTLADARAQIADLVHDHASTGSGILVLAHPPGAGKGHNTVVGLQRYLQTAPAPGNLVWTAIRKDQIHDQSGLDLTSIHGRTPENCKKFAETQALAQRGYRVRPTLCERRCAFRDGCPYLRQFAQKANFFAPQPLLLATPWWKDARVLVLDEFDPARLTCMVTLDSASLARIGNHTTDPHAQTVLRVLAALLGSATDRTIAGSLLLAELEALARADGLDLRTILTAAMKALPPPEEEVTLPGVPHGATLADYEALPPNYLGTILTQLHRELMRTRVGRAYTSRLEISGGQLRLYLRHEHLITQFANPAQPKLILDATVNEDLLHSLFPDTPLRIERPVITNGAQVVQVITRDWAKSTLHGPRRETWYDVVAAEVRPGRPTLAVCTKECAGDLRAALVRRGHPDVAVAHYGALRGTNAYKGYDVILTQVYHPNMQAIIRTGRALFADDPEPLDETTIITKRSLTDTHGSCWVVEIHAFADPRLDALLTQQREAEMTQAALRGRPFDHPEAQITLLFGLPLPTLPPTEVREEKGAETSNMSRQEAAHTRLIAAAQQLLDSGTRVISVEMLADATGQSVVTIRKHLAAISGRLRLRMVNQRRMVSLPNGGQRPYERIVLMRRGRDVPPADPAADVPTDGCEGTDQAHNKSLIMCLIHPPAPTGARVMRRSPHPCMRPASRRPARKEGIRLFRSRRSTDFRE